jgi:hypothetical protein
MKNIGYRKTAVMVGALFITGTVAGVLSGIMTVPIQSASEPLTSISTNETQWILGTLLVLVMGFALSMIPVLLYPAFKKHNEVLAFGAVVFRGVLEAVCYIAVAASMLLLLSVSQAYAGDLTPDAAALRTAGALLTNAGEWFSQITSFVFSIGALFIYFLFYQTRLVPRWLSGWGFIGAMLYFAAPLVSMLSAQHPALSLGSPLGFLMAPLALQEMVFAVWLIVKGFNGPPMPANAVIRGQAVS